MEVLSPDLVWLDGRCHRVNNQHDILPPSHHHHPEHHDYEGVISDDDDDEDMLNLEIITTPKGRIQTSMHVASAYHKYIIGKGGSKLKALMHNTQTDIKLPPRNKNGDIVISGGNPRNVLNAARKINSIIISARPKQKVNYFLAIPLNNDEIMNNFEKFKDSVLSSGTFRGVDKSIFTEGVALHLTLHVFAIMDEVEKEYIKSLLDIAKKDIIDPICKNKSIPLIISNIAYMNDDPTCIHVLYAEAVEKNESQKGLLVRLIEKLSDFFRKKGYDVSKSTSKVHATLMNSRHRMTENEDPNAMRIPFDGSKIIKDHSNFYFGQCDAKEIQFFSTGRLPNNSYASSGTIQIV